MNEGQEQRSGQPAMNRSKQAGMAIKTIVVLVVGLTLASTHFAAAQPGKAAKIGFLTTASASSIASNLEVFRQVLQEFGYIEGKNIIIEYRWAEGKLDRLPELAAELVSLGVNIIVTVGTPPVLAAKQATNTIPIIAANADNLVELGVVASLARPPDVETFAFALEDRARAFRLLGTTAGITVLGSGAKQH